jgi:hypothetical protein
MDNHQSSPIGKAFGALSGACSSICNSAHSLYMRLPEFRPLDRATTAILIFSVLAYFAIWLVYFFITPLPAVTLSNIEQPLSKNAHLSLIRGESYVYSVESGTGEQFSVIYDVKSDPQCPGVVVEQSIGGNMVGVSCVLQDGTEWQGTDGNVSAGNGTTFLFEPWMLALSDNFSWAYNSTLSSMGTEVSSTTSYESLGRKNALGRNAFGVDVKSNGEHGGYLLVDDEKRVVLWMNVGNASLFLVKAPFPLNASSIMDIASNSSGFG